jgi:hypothetical protein
MKAILGDEINELIERKDLQAIENIKTDDESVIDIDQLPLLKTPKGVYTDLIRNLSVSRCGERIWGVHYTEYPKWRLLMQCFRTRKIMVFNYEHQNGAMSVIVAENLGLAMTSGRDRKTVLHCLISGKTIKVVDIGVSCFYRLGSVVALGDSDKKKVRFFDLVKKKMLDVVPVETGFFILCMQMSIRNSLRNNQHPQSSLFLGGYKSSKIVKIILSKEIIQKSILYL